MHMFPGPFRHLASDLLNDLVTARRTCRSHCLRPSGPYLGCPLRRRPARQGRPRARINETPKNRCGTYIRCMLLERMRKRLSAGTGFIEPCLPSPADRPHSGSPAP
jgi:hypothetical protein